MDTVLANLLSGAAGGVLVLIGSSAFSYHETRRAERNQIGSRIHAALLHQIDHPRAGGDGVASRDLDALVSLQPRWRRRRVAKAVEEYRAACQQTTHSDALGQLHMTNPAALSSAARALIPFTLHH